MVRWLCAVGVLGLSGCTPAPKGAAVEPVAAVAADQTEVSLLLVGDTSVARGVAELINGVEAENKPAHGPAFPFELIAPLLHAHDLVFANLECVLSDSNAEEALKTYRIRAPTQNAQALHDVGIDVVSVANNHAADFGVQGMTSTLQTLKDEGVIAVGAQLTPGWAQPPTIVQVGVYRVGFLAYNQHGDEYGHDNFRPAPAQYYPQGVLRGLPLKSGSVLPIRGRGDDVDRIPRVCRRCSRRVPSWRGVRAWTQATLVRRPQQRRRAVVGFAGDSTASHRRARRNLAVSTRPRCRGPARIDVDGQRHR